MLQKLKKGTYSYDIQYNTIQQPGLSFGTTPKGLRRFLKSKRAREAGIIGVVPGTTYIPSGGLYSSTLELRSHPYSGDDILICGRDKWSHNWAVENYGQTPGAARKNTRRKFASQFDSRQGLYRQDGTYVLKPHKNRPRLRLPENFNFQGFQ